MSKVFWQAKIWGLLQDSLLKLSHSLQGAAENSSQAVDHWQPSDWIKQASAMAEASDRALFDLIPCQPEPQQSVIVSHLLSGEKLPLNCNWQAVEQLQTRIRETITNQSPLKAVIPPAGATVDQLKQQFWWLWRCLPEIIARADKVQLLAPAAHILPDVSLWSQASLTAAMGGALAGYNNEVADNGGDRPHLAVFSFTPVQELIKASRKIRDFWAGSWVLHYLSAKICWKLAQQYGPDSLIYPSLFQQPLIDHWLIQQWPEFSDVIDKHSAQQLLTAGFPNVIVLLLPKAKVKAAMQTARQSLNEEWLNLGAQVFDELHNKRKWMPGLQENNRTWKGWLQSQWQPYWTALPVGHLETENLSIEATSDEFEAWLNRQNIACNLKDNKQLFIQEEKDLLTAVLNAPTASQSVTVNAGSWWPYIFDQLRFSLSSVKSARVWKLPTAFGPRSTISGFGPVVYPDDQRKRLTETDTSQFWGESSRLDLDESKDSEESSQLAGLFDGREQLNATEILKRGLHKVLPRIFQLSEEEVAASYPDLTAGVAGYLKVYASQTEHIRNFRLVCQAIIREFENEESKVDGKNWVRAVIREMQHKWGIPWIDEFPQAEDNNTPQPRRNHPRLLNAGWLVEDAVTPKLEELRQELRKSLDLEKIKQKYSSTTDQNEKTVLQTQVQTLEASTLKEPAIIKKAIIELKSDYRSSIQNILDSYYPNNNPADWYVLAAGDGDGMRHWLKGKPLEKYAEYMPDALEIAEPINSSFTAVKNAIKKRMGPSTHAALSRALLDFSNQLVPYLTERRYAGRLIYSGGDDVLAYTNLWEWDQWLWDIRQCFRGGDDPHNKFESTGNYWHWKTAVEGANPDVMDRPLFTMGQKATVSFGLVIAHHSVPLAIALENLWEAEQKAKAHFCNDAQPEKAKDAVQVRVIYANGNTLTTTGKFEAFHQWQNLLPEAGDPHPKVTSALLEQAAQLWSQYPAPIYEAIEPWTQVFCSRRDLFSNDDDARDAFRQQLANFLQCLWRTTQEKDRANEVQNWLKLAAFNIRTRQIKINSPGGQS